MICHETPVTQGCKLNCCEHKMCMDCAVKVVIFSSEHPRCPQCRRDFETVTSKSRMQLQLTEGFCCYLSGFRARMGRQGPRCMIGRSLLDRNQMKIASHIVVDKVKDADGKRWLKFYISCLLRHPDPQTYMIVYDTDILTPPVRTRPFRLIKEDKQYACDRPWYERIIEDAQWKLNPMTYNSEIPLFWMKAHVSKTFVKLLGHGNKNEKYQMVLGCPLGNHIQPAPGERILIMECKVA